VLTRITWFNVVLCDGVLEKARIADDAGVQAGRNTGRHRDGRRMLRRNPVIMAVAAGTTGSWLWNLIRSREQPSRARDFLRSGASAGDLARGGLAGFRQLSVLRPSHMAPSQRRANLARGPSVERQSFPAASLCGGYLGKRLASRFGDTVPSVSLRPFFSLLMLVSFSLAVLFLPVSACRHIVTI